MLYCFLWLIDLDLCTWKIIKLIFILSRYLVIMATLISRTSNTGYLIKDMWRSLIQGTFSQLFLSEKKFVWRY